VTVAPVARLLFNGVDLPGDRVRLRTIDVVRVYGTIPLRDRASGGRSDPFASRLGRPIEPAASAHANTLESTFGGVVRVRV
jgi:hypothetical protein